MKTLIIAEAGVNHNGDLEVAKQMILEAKACGVDIIKFQTGKAELVISKFAPKANYQEKTTGSEETQLEMCKKILLPFENYKVLKTMCEQVGIQFLSTPFDLESIDFLESIGIALWKIPSGEITNLPYLIKIARTGKEVILSTGMSNLEEIAQAITLLIQNGTSKITLLHCNTEYPTPYEDVNLRAMVTLKEKFGVAVGYSDHTLGIEVPIAAVALGATVIEKHFTLDKNMEGPDHQASLDTNELAQMVKSIRKIEQAMGTGEKIASNSEKKNIAIARKSIIAKREIFKGEVLCEENITTKRPGNGVSPMKWFEVIGTKAIRDFKEDELIEV